MKLDEDKIAVIICVNNEELYREAEYFIKKQQLDEGYTLELIPVWGADSITAGYNWAIKQSNAKYKIYIHQDVFIVYHQTVAELIKLFKSNHDIGLVGMIGSDMISETGCWWEKGEAHGAYIDSHNEKMDLYRINLLKPFADVKMLDGFFMATQYDIRWRDDVFDGWHFYDASQCMEFLREGYRIVVPYQDKTWCVHDCGILYNYKYEYERYRKRFIDEYFK